MDYKEKMKRLEEIETQLSASLPLDEAMKLYEEALEHYRELQAYYVKMEEKFDQLSKED